MHGPHGGSRLQWRQIHDDILNITLGSQLFHHFVHLHSNNHNTTADQNLPRFGVTDWNRDITLPLQCRLASGITKVSISSDSWPSQIQRPSHTDVHMPSPHSLGIFQIIAMVTSIGTD